jgi:dihydrofolate reductase
MVIGGESIYAAFLPLAERLYVTLVHAGIPGDTRFPSFDLGAWHEVERADHSADAQNPHPYSFLVYERRTD